MVTVYYGERNQIRISQKKRHVGQSPGHFQAQILQLSSPSGVVDRATFWQQCVTTHMKYCQRGKLLQAFATRAFHKEMTDHPCGHLSFQPLCKLSLWPKDPTINPFVRNYLGWPRLPGKQRHPFQAGHSRGWGQKPDLSLDKVNSLLHRASLPHIIWWLKRHLKSDLLSCDGVQCQLILSGA